METAAAGTEDTAGAADSAAGGLIGSADDKAAAAVPAAGADKSAAADKVAAQTPEQVKAAADEVAKAEINIKFPDGFRADASTVEGFKKLAKELGLDSEKAQKVADFQVSAQQAQQKAQDLALDQQEKAWAKELAEDKDFGGKNFESSKLAIGRLLTKFDTADKSARKIIGESGLGSNPVVCKFLARIGAAISEDKVGGQAAKEGAQKQTIDSPEFLKGLFNNTKRAS